MCIPVTWTNWKSQKTNWLQKGGRGAEKASYSAVWEKNKQYIKGYHAKFV
jgi:hypothetical protein